MKAALAFQTGREAATDGLCAKAMKPPGNWLQDNGTAPLSTPAPHPLNHHDQPTTTSTSRPHPHISYIPAETPVAPWRTSAI